MIQTEELKEVGIDYPQHGEMMQPGPYSFRISAPAESKEVRISIDDGPWQACRKDNGHWWFDAQGQDAGIHVALCRVIEEDGSILVTSPRLFKVQGRA